MQVDNKNPKLAWTMWLTTLSFLFYQFIARSSFPTVLTERLMSHFQLDAAGIGVLVSCYYWVYTLMQIPAGILVDKFSLRKITTIGILMCSFGVLLFIATPNCYIAACGQIMLGFGSSFAFMSALKVVSNYFPAKEIPMKSSLTMAVGCSGPVVGGPAVAFLVEHFEWISLMRCFALFGLLLAAIAMVVMQDEKVEDVQLSQSSVISSLKTIIFSRQVWVLALYTMAQYAPLSAMGDLWGRSFIQKVCDVDAKIASVISNMIYIGVVVGSPVFAYLAKTMNSYKKPMIIGIIGAAASMAVILACGKLPLTAAFFLFFSLGFSCASALAYPLVLVMFPPSLGASASGFVNMASMVSGIILMPLVGYIVKCFWNGVTENGVSVYSLNDFRLGLLSVLAFLTVGILLSLLVQDRSPQQKRTEESK
ncbi:MAG: MFS transporter [Holosporaceae bacterium]|nr:MFS transporter [Holosporaceae bacterium]